MPIQGGGVSPGERINLEGISINVSQLRHIVAGLALGLNAIIPGLGFVVAAIVELIGIRGTTQHLGVEEGYRVAREVADRVGLSVREQFKPNNPDTLPLRVAATRRLARTSVAFFNSRYPNGFAQPAVNQIKKFTTSQTDEIYTVFYLSAYVMARYADAEHWEEEMERFLSDVLILDLERFVEEVNRESQNQGFGGSKALMPLALLAVPGVFLFKKLFSR